MASHVVPAERKFSCTLESLWLWFKSKIPLFLGALSGAPWSTSTVELIEERVLSVNRHSEESQIHSSANEHGFGREFLSVVTQRNFFFPYPEERIFFFPYPKQKPHRIWEGWVKLINFTKTWCVSHSCFLTGHFMVRQHIFLFWSTSLIKCMWHDARGLWCERTKKFGAR